jgi:electron transport complex protein RnfA
MTDIPILLIGAIFVNNLALTQMLGVVPLLKASGSLATAAVMAAVATCILTLSSMATWLCYHYLLLPFDLAFLRTLVYILLIVVVMKLTELVLSMQAPAQHCVLATSLPLITLNCAVLGVALINDNKANSFIESVCYGFGTGAGLALALIMLATLRERLTCADVPEPFQGSAITLITTGLMSLAFMGFAGLV